MTDVKHTPGPWQVGQSYYSENKVYASNAEDRSSICTCNVFGSGPECQWEETVANARLIAAAPDLDRAARLMIGVLIRWYDFNPEAKELLKDEQVQEAWEALRKAVEKVDSK